MYIGICEDEKVQVQYLIKQIEKCCVHKDEEYRIETFESAEELLFKYEQGLPFDCLLLDIRMGQMDGMELAADIRKRDRQIPIIFVTGDRDAVFDGYKVGAVRYLLKPIKEEAIAEALDYVKMQISGECAAGKEQKADYFCFNYGGEYIKLEKSAMITIVVKGHYVTIRTLDNAGSKSALQGNGQKNFREYTFKETMKGIREQLKDERFSQASRSVLVNLEHVESITRTECVLSTGESVSLSRTCYNDFNQAFIRYYK